MATARDFSTLSQQFSSLRALLLAGPSVHTRVLSSFPNEILLSGKPSVYVFNNAKKLATIDAQEYKVWRKEQTRVEYRSSEDFPNRTRLCAQGNSVIVNRVLTFT